MAVEQWQPVDGFDMYMVSNLARVKKVGGPNGSRDITAKPWLARTGYLNVSLYTDERTATGRKKAFKKRVHRLVALAFIPGYEAGKEVNHLNGIKTDNRLENLEWCTRRQNAQHACDNKLIKHARGNAHGKSKLTDQKVVEIRRLAKSGSLSLNAIGRLYGIAGTQISQIVRHLAWKHVPENGETPVPNTNAVYEDDGRKAQIALKWLRGQL